MLRDKVHLATAMTIFGSVGLVRRYIPYSSAFIAFVRGFLGALVLLVWMLLRHEGIDRQGIQAHWGKLLLSGIALGLNWVFLFEAYRFTSISAATMAYYMAPIWVLILAVPLFGEVLSKGQGLCVLGALVGMVLVSGVWETGLSGARGIAFGLLASLFYAGLILLNKAIPDLAGPDRTLVQLGLAALVLLPYVLWQAGEESWLVTPFVVGMVIVAGVVHTGLAYSLYFGSIAKLPAATVALFSYIDPVVAVLLSVLVLGEGMTVVMAVGIFLVVGSTVLSDIFGLRRARAIHTYNERGSHL